MVCPLKTKDQASTAIKNSIEWLETQTNRKVKSILTDNGSEYVNKELETYLSNKGIQHGTTIPYSPQMNGKAERLNRTLLDKARSLLLASNLPPSLWLEAIFTANYLRNRTPTSSSNKTPYERMWNKTPDLKHLRTFGATAYPHIPKEKRTSKFGPRAHIGYMVGYSLQSKGWRIYLPQQRAILESRDCVFDESTHKPAITPQPTPQAQEPPTDWIKELTPVCDPLTISLATTTTPPQPATPPSPTAPPGDAPLPDPTLQPTVPLPPPMPTNPAPTQPPATRTSSR